MTALKPRGYRIWDAGGSRPYWISNRANVTAADDLTPEEIQFFITENKEFQLIKAMITG